MAIHRTASPKYRPSGLRTSQIRGFSSTPTVRVFPRPSTATPFGLAKKLHLPKHDVLKYKKPKKHTNPPPKKSITVKIPMALDPEELRLAERTNLGLSVQALTELSISPVTISANLRGGKGPPLDDYTGRVTIKDPVDTSHRLLDLYDGEVTGAGGPSKVMVNVLKVIGDGPGDHSFDKWTAAVYERLKSEIGAWKKINGPFVHYIGFARVDDVPAVLTQAVEGTRAKDFLESASVQDRRSLIVGFAKALEALHAEQLPHGNLEPQHFVVDTKGKAKLSGFCFNHMIERELSKVKPVGEHHRSARYAAPEALEDKTVADKLDVYSFACVALELITGKQPFHMVKGETAVRKLVIEGRAPFSGPYPELMPYLWWITFKSCFSKGPKTRPSMTSVYENLDGTANSSPVKPFFGGYTNLSLNHHNLAWYG